MMPDPPLCHVADRPRPDVPPRRPFSQPACYRRGRRLQTQPSDVFPCRSLTQPAARPHLPSCRLRSSSLQTEKTPSRSRPQPATCQRCPADHAAVCPTRPRSFTPRTRRCPSRPKLPRDTTLTSNFQVKTPA
uniref:Uncharacterized protein n=1 Tax=Branchiostoma floridae TaxID=7739 RepID=C3Z7A4_BRAFL|eukprot:XP_002595688.1 hypothetical protein BRAFLDRAFT_117536 [Branchiostoma floridae]